MDVTYLFVRNLINNFNYWYWTVVVIVGHTITRYKIAEMARNTVRCFQFFGKKEKLRQYVRQTNFTLYLAYVVQCAQKFRGSKLELMSFTFCANTHNQNHSIYISMWSCSCGVYFGLVVFGWLLRGCGFDIGFGMYGGWFLFGGSLGGFWEG